MAEEAHKEIMGMSVVSIPKLPVVEFIDESAFGNFVRLKGQPMLRIEDIIVLKAGKRFIVSRFVVISEGIMYFIDYKSEECPGDTDDDGTVC